MAKDASPTPVANADVAIASPTLVSRLIAEAFGTFVLVGSIVGTALFMAPVAGPVAVALAAGLSVLAAAYAVGHISGGHFNPAVTLGAAAAGRFAWTDVLPYIGAQVVGAILATTVLLGISAGGPADPFAGFAATSNGYDEASPGGFNLGAVLLGEIVVTAIFVYVILGSTDRRAPSGFAPVAIGLALTVGHLLLIPISNASLNPARSIAPAIFGGTGPLEQLWVFVVAPIVGALIAGFSYKFLFDRKQA